MSQAAPPENPSDDPAPGRSRVRRLSAWAWVQIVALAGVIITTATAAVVSGAIDRLVFPKAADATTAPSTPATASSPTPERSAEASTGGTFAVAVSIIYKCGQAYALPGRLDPQTEAGKLNSEPMPQVLEEFGGSPQSTVTIEMIFSGGTERPTRILDVTVDRLETAPNLDGSALYTPCQGDKQTISTFLNLDHPPRSLMDGNQAYFDGHDLDVTSTDRETLRIAVTAAEHSYHWIFAIRYLNAADAVATAYVGNDGRLYDRPDQVPASVVFSLTGPASKYAVAYQASDGRFSICSTCPSGS